MTQLRKPNAIEKLIANPINYSETHNRAVARGVDEGTRPVKLPDAGVVDEHVDAAECPLRFVEERARLSQLTAVPFPRDA